MKKILTILLILTSITLVYPSLVFANNPTPPEETASDDSTSETSEDEDADASDTGDNSYGASVGETNRCDNSNEFLTMQDAEGNYFCAALDPAEDFDGDGIANRSDNCPIDRNGRDPETGEYNGKTDDEPDETVDEDAYQADNDNDGVGDECDASPRADLIRNIQNSLGLGEDETNMQSEQAYGNTIEKLQACLNLGGINHSNCNISTFSSNLSNKKDKEKFYRLYNALLNNEIITTIEEPISNEGIYQRARVCSTKYLRDKNGIVQPTSSVNLYDPNLTENELKQRLESLRFLTTNNKCEDFFVERCVESNNIDYTAKAGEPLPTRVFCSNVQILFASSGSDLVKKYVSLIYRLASGIIGVIAVVVIIINGIIISASGGEQGTIDNAKNRIIQSLVSLAILFLSGIILYSINPNFFRVESPPELQQSEIQPESSPDTTDEAT